MYKVNIARKLKFILIVFVIGFFLLPIQYIVFVLALLTQFAYEVIHREVFGMRFPWGRTVDIRRVVEFLFTAFGIHFIYTLIYSIISFFVEKKTEYFLLVTLIFTVLFSIVAFDIRRPIVAGLPVIPDLGYHAAYAFLFAMIMFAVFTFLLRLLDKKTEWKKWKIIPFSFILSTFSGSILSVVVWVILFLIFHGASPENWI